jgi:hypothetical protein
MMSSFYDIYEWSNCRGQDLEHKLLDGLPPQNTETYLTLVRFEHQRETAQQYQTPGEGAGEVAGRVDQETQIAPRNTCMNLGHRAY